MTRDRLINRTAAVAIFISALFAAPSLASAATSIYRSVGPGATAALATGTSNALTISGSTATFASGLPTNVGVGDAIQYDSDGNGTIDSIAFIHGRTSATVYTVKSASGGTPTAVTGDNDWSVFRAYTSLANAEAGTENASIDVAVSNFDSWTGGVNLTTADELWNIALYANGTTADSTGVTIDGWTTSATQYLNIYTPTSTDQVGTTQRHAGVWDDTKYKMTVSSGSAITVSDNNVHISGIQISGTSASSQILISLPSSGGNTNAYIYDNILTKPAGGSGNNAIQVSVSGTIAYIYNNLFYGFVGASAAVIYDSSGSGSFLYVYNNTIAEASTTGGLAIKLPLSAARAVLKNNLFYNDNIVATGTAAVGSDYNATNNASMGSGYSVSGGGNTHTRVSQTFTFAGLAAKNFHLASNDAGALDFGVNLSADANLAFSGDIDDQTRPTTWDIGADEYLAPDVTPPVVSNGSPTGVQPYGTTQVSLSVATDENATCKYGTVANTAYASIANTFATTGGTSQAQTITGLTNGGSYTYYVRCQDTSGNPDTADYTISFSVAATDTTPPTVSLTAPSDGSYASTTETISASASDTGGIVGVQFKLDSTTNIGAEDTSSPYSISWDPTTTTAGAHTIVAVARDAAGNYATSTAVTVTVDYTGATLDLTSPASGSTIKGTEVISYTGSATTSVMCSVDQVRWTDCGNNETYMAQIAGYPLVSRGGTFTLYMKDTDLAGNTTSVSATNLTRSTWSPPIGIPDPSFGITQTVESVYGSKDYYTYWIDSTDPNATDTNNASGTPAKPRMTIPSTLTLGAGDVVQIRGGTYTTSNDRFAIVANGTSNAPIFITGIMATSTPVIQKWFHVQQGQYVIIEGLKIQPPSDNSALVGGIDFRPTAEGIAIHHDAVRYVTAAGMATTSTNKTASQTFLVDNIAFMTKLHDLVFYNNVSHDSGNWMSATEDDQHSFYIGSSTYSAWILNNVAFRSSGDGVQVANNGYFSSDHIYVGGNILYDHKENGVDIKQANDVVISQNVMHTFRNTPSGGASAVAAVVHYNPARIWFIGNDIYDTEVGINSTGASDLHIIGNVLHDIDRYPTTVETHASTSPLRIGSAMFFYSTATTTIANNTIYNTGGGIDADLGSYGVTVENNIVGKIDKGVNDYHMILLANSSVPASMFTIRNNIFYQPGSVALTSTSSIMTCTGCTYSNNDPLLADPSNSIFTLQGSSPARDAGVTETFSDFTADYGMDITPDFASTTRPQGSAWDIGAYEYTGLVSAPTVSSSAASSVGTTTATLNGSISATGGENATGSGFAWGTASTLSAGDTATTTEGGQNGTVSFASSLTGLSCDTTYYFRSYASNSGGTGHGSIKNLTTNACASTLSTDAASSLSTTGATLNATISATGGANAEESGFAYGTDSALQTGVSTTTDGTQSGAASFTHALSGLTCATTYYARAYVLTVAGYAVGSITPLTTSACAASTPASTVLPSSGGLGSGASSFTAPLYAPGYAPASSALSASAAISITASLSQGAQSSQVASLQKLLNSQGFTVADAGPGSLGHETSYYGPATMKAVEAFQKAYKIAGPGDPGYGYVGPKTRAVLNKLMKGYDVKPVETPAAAPSAPAAIPAGLGQGSASPSVQALQSFLNARGFTVSSAGAGSLGHETSYYGPATTKAVEAFQKAYKIAGPGDPGYGYVGPKTSQKMNSL